MEKKKYNNILNIKLEGLLIDNSKAQEMATNIGLQKATGERYETIKQKLGDQGLGAILKDISISKLEFYDSYYHKLTPKEELNYLTLKVCPDDLRVLTLQPNHLISATTHYPEKYAKEIINRFGLNGIIDTIFAPNKLEGSFRYYDAFAEQISNRIHDEYLSTNAPHQFVNVGNSKADMLLGANIADHFHFDNGAITLYNCYLNGNEGHITGNTIVSHDPYGYLGLKSFSDLMYIDSVTEGFDD